MNSVILTGRITKKGETKYTNNGLANCIFNIAVKKDYAVKEGEKDSYFIDCTVWNKQCEYLQKFCNVGDMVCVLGKLQLREWIDQNNQKHSITEINCDRIELVARSQNNVQNQAQNQVQQPIANANQPMQQFAQPTNQPIYQQQQQNQNYNYNNYNGNNNNINAINNNINNVNPNYQYNQQPNVQQPMNNNFNNQNTNYQATPTPNTQYYNQAQPNAMNYNNIQPTQQTPINQNQTNVPNTTIDLNISDDDLPF